MQEETTSEYEYEDNPDDWDWDNPIVVRGAKAPRHVFSVRFEAAELDTIREAAQAAGMKTGEFIRNAALAAARGDRERGDPLAVLTALVSERGMRVTIEPAGSAPVEPARDQDTAA
jgi:hypothetical protein